MLIFWNFSSCFWLFRCDDCTDGHGFISFYTHSVHYTVILKVHACKISSSDLY